MPQAETERLTRLLLSTVAGRLLSRSMTALELAAESPRHFTAGLL